MGCWDRRTRVSVEFCVDGMGVCQVVSGERWLRKRFLVER